jgi:GNAT superfamily N-acetyltransferase
MVRIRPATVNDAPAILALIRELADYEKLTHLLVTSEQDLRTHLFGPSPAAEALVAEFDAGVVGYAIYFRTFSTFLGRPGLFLEDVYVQPAHRRRGIGKAFMIELGKLCVQRHYGRLEWSVLTWNTPSIGFYKALGATALDDWMQMRMTGESLVKLASERVAPL